MDWSSWRDAKVGEVMAETAEALVTELLLSRKVALDTNRTQDDEASLDLYAPKSLHCVSRTRRVMQTLGAIVMSSDLENYYQAVYLLEFLHGLYPNVISVQQYSQLLVYLKSQAVIYVACCSPVSDRIQAAHCLIRQLFDNYSCRSGDHSDKMVLENAHKLGSTEVKKILSNGKLSLVGLSVQPLTRELYKKMCWILKELLGGIDRNLPLPTVVQVCGCVCVCIHVLSCDFCSPFLRLQQLIEKKGNSSTHMTEVPDVQCCSHNDGDCLPSSHSQLVTRRYRTRRKRKIVPPDRFSYGISTITNKSMKTSDEAQATDSDSVDTVVAESVTSSVIPNVTALANLN
ncbi:uncharacterized protein [Dysidea avara]